MKIKLLKVLARIYNLRVDTSKKMFDLYVELYDAAKENGDTFEMDEYSIWIKTESDIYQKRASKLINLNLRIAQLMDERLLKQKEEEAILRRKILVGELCQAGIIFTIPDEYE